MPLVWLIAIGVLALLLVGGGIAAVIAFAVPDTPPPTAPRRPRATTPTRTPAQPSDRPADDWRRKKQPEWE
jgi:hypothetical protein